MSVHDQLARMRGAQATAPESTLQEAHRLVHGDRGAAYGHPYDDYSRTSRLWEALLGLQEGTIGPRKAALMMALMKASREINQHKRDNLVDLAGYAECAQMIAEREAGEASARAPLPSLTADDLRRREGGGVV